MLRPDRAVRLARPVAASALFAIFSMFCAAPLDAQTVPASVTVTVSTQDGSVLLPGAAVTLSSAGAGVLSTEYADEQGRARFTGLAPGQYAVAGVLDGFSEARATVTAESARDSAVRLDLPIAGVAEHVDVVSAAEPVRPTIATTLTPKATLESRTIQQLPIRDNSVLSALKLLAGIVEGPGGVSIKGGRPNQSALQIGMTNLADATMGNPLFRLPPDAVDSVEVFSNPYAVEFGRFSSGLTVVNTRRGGDAWQTYLNSPDISFRTAYDNPFAIKGIESFGPRIGFGGPLIKGRLFLEQSAQFRYEVGEVRSRPEDQTRVTKWVSAFTRLDANLTPSERLTGTLNVFPSRVDDATLSTFNDPSVTADVNDTLITGTISAHSTLSKTAVLESTVQFAGFGVDVSGHGTGSMELQPQQNTGNFYNTQSRQTDSLQWAEAATLSGRLGSIEHLFKFGGDFMRTSFSGLSESLPVEVRRVDGTLARRLTFAGPIAQQVTANDVSLFAQDRIQATARLLVEAGWRLDWDGVLDRVNATPRFGAVVLLNEKGSAALRGGYGLFFERTPSVVGAFSQFEMTTDTRYASDGVTPIAPPMPYLHRTSGDLDTPYSTTWNLAFDDHPTSSWFFRAAWLHRAGRHELIVDPETAPGMSHLVLSSDGQSSYRETEFTLRYAPGPRFEVGGSYVHSSARANLNAYTAFFDNIRWPIVGEDAYAPTSADVPHRVTANVRALPTPGWLLSSVVEVRNGFPYSATNEMLDWVGPRNELYRFPTVASVDVGVERRMTFMKWKPWIGVRVFNLLNRFNPAEVQNNITSPAFGSFYNSYPRQFRIQVRLD